MSKWYSSPRWTGELSDCSLPVTLDTYSNCSFGCVYCFSQYQRAIGNCKKQYLRNDVKSVSPQRVKDIFSLKKECQFSDYIRSGRAIQWGGLSDQFDGYERKYGVTLELLKFFKELNYPISFSTKSTWWLQDKRYTELFKGQSNWNVKFSIITDDEHDAALIEKGVPSPSERLDAIARFTELEAGGATLRLRPFIIGVTSKTYKSLINKAADNGATAMTTEFFCLERRSVKTAKENYKVISECIGHDIVEFYTKNSKGCGYLRLNRSVKEPYIRKMRDIAHSRGMRFYVSDAHFKECSDGTCCCGLPEDWGFSRSHFAEALQLCKKNGSVTFDEIADSCDFLSFEFYKADGFNTVSVEHRAKFEGCSMLDYLRYLWNNPKAGQSPYKMFEGVMRPNGLDGKGNIIYAWNQERTFVNGGSSS